MTRASKILLSSLLIIAMGTYVVTKMQTAHVSKVRSNEEYWSSTGLKPQALEELLQESSCKSSERYFLACVNAIVSASQKYGYDLSFDGDIIPARRGAKAQALTEKEMLAPWQALLAARGHQPPVFSFTRIWASLSSHLKTSQQSYAIGVGINGFLSVFKDPHTYLLPAEYYNEVVAKTNHKSLSVGVVVGQNDAGYFVKKVLENSTAALAGVKKGDQIVEIQDEKANELTTYQLADLLRGEEGSTLHLKLSRRDRAIELSILRSEKTLPTVSVTIIEGPKPVGVVTINKFAVDTCEQTKSHLLDLISQNVRGLLLDLRDNPGGQMDEAACVAGLFVGAGKKIFEIRLLDPSAPHEIVRSEQGKVYNGPVAVLINSGSASAAEIVAGVLQYYKRAVLVGERSFGKGSFQEGEIWSKNDKLALFETKGFYYLPSGETPQMVGLDPDIKVDFKDRFALREVDQFVNPLRASGPTVSPVLNQNLRPELIGCVDFESDLLPAEDPEMKEAHRVVSCR